MTYLKSSGGLKARILNIKLIKGKKGGKMLYSAISYEATEGHYKSSLWDP